MTSDSEPPAIIFHITDAARAAAARESGRLSAASLSREGFIHASRAEQLLPSLALHFRGVDEVVLAALSAEALGSSLVYEASRGGALFPHIYAPIPLAAVVGWRREASVEGRFVDSPALRLWLAEPETFDGATEPGAR